MRADFTNKEIWACVNNLARAHKHEGAVAEAIYMLGKMTEPIDMVLHCPECSVQHIDGSEFLGRVLIRADELLACDEIRSHRSHTCGNCGHIWRPADVPTNGVAAVRTKGKGDSPLAHPIAGAWDTHEQTMARIKAMVARCEAEAEVDAASGIHEVLKERLREGPQPASVVLAAFAADGVPHDRVIRIAKRLGVIRFISATPRSWHWVLPTGGVDDGVGGTVVERDHAH